MLNLPTVLGNVKLSAVNITLIGKILRILNIHVNDDIVSTVDEIVKAIISTTPDAKINDLFSDGNLVEFISSISDQVGQKQSKEDSVSIEMYRSAGVKCPECGFVHALEHFAPKLFNKG